jgi:hypothetical protein
VVRDTRGYDKEHPVIILTPDGEIPVEEVLWGVVCSTTAHGLIPWEWTWIEVPHHPQGLTKSKLNKPTVACCEWVAKIEKCNIDAGDLGGQLEEKLLLAVVEMVTAVQPTPTPPVKIKPPAKPLTLAEFRKRSKAKTSEKAAGES